MATGPNDIINAALQLPEADRWLIAARLLETLSEDSAGLSESDPGVWEELERRVNDGAPTVSVSQLWKQD
jgi:hypothetical protein